MPVIDHKAFPHILDAVIANASHDVLFAFRVRSKELGTRLDGGQHDIYSRDPPFPRSARSPYPVLGDGTLDLRHLTVPPLVLDNTTCQ
ncbi:hypothetical protein CspHIS471_0302690 [Cutaneotrichosporon sp. HIS471]|nr:hypothetical protein CspHIS471_0302690 [Cutaneotrichosporon sp. HIS471]